MQVECLMLEREKYKNAREGTNGASCLRVRETGLRLVGETKTGSTNEYRSRRTRGGITNEEQQ